MTVHRAFCLSTTTRVTVSVVRTSPCLSLHTISNETLSQKSFQACSHGGRRPLVMSFCMRQPTSSHDAVTVLLLQARLEFDPVESRASGSPLAFAVVLQCLCCLRGLKGFRLRPRVRRQHRCFLLPLVRIRQLAVSSRRRDWWTDQLFPLLQRWNTLNIFVRLTGLRGARCCPTNVEWRQVQLLLILFLELVHSLSDRRVHAVQHPQTYFICLHRAMVKPAHLSGHFSCGTWPLGGRAGHLRGLRLRRAVTWTAHALRKTRHRKLKRVFLLGATAAMGSPGISCARRVSTTSYPSTSLSVPLT